MIKSIKRLIESDKQIIFIGSGSYFTDSMMFFKRHGFKLICIKLKEKTSWFDNYELFKSMGFDIIDDDKENSFLNKIKLTKHTLIFRGSYSGDAVQLQDSLKHICKRELEIFYALTKKNFDEKTGAKSVLSFCGDNIYQTQEYINWFAEKTQYVDLCTFDNDFIQNYVLTNIPSLASKRHVIAYFETPLSCFVNHNKSYKIEKNKFIALGRTLCSFDLDKYISIQKFPLHKGLANSVIKDIFCKIRYRTFAKFLNKRRFQMAGVAVLNRLKRERALFFKVYQKHAFGLSHFYNLFDVNPTDIVKDKDIFVYDKQIYSHIKESNLPDYDFVFPQIYALDNNASKDVTYLMHGIIPVIPHIEHSFYKELYNKKMAVLVRNVDDLQKLSLMSDEEIQKYRDNIYANKEMFVFEPVGKLLLDILK
ncbi:MAG: hypothetical protein J6S74_03855 [Alphaproteobacteria bacterium]|nr:hypothetical protein [Alphaproteobacteria bacterium]